MVPVWPMWDGIVPVIPAEVVQPAQTELRGGLQLDVQPWRAEVYVDGDYAGLVQDFGGYYRPLELIPGPHAITIVAPDFDPLDVRCRHRSWSHDDVSGYPQPRFGPLTCGPHLTLGTTEGHPAHIQFTARLSPRARGQTDSSRSKNAR